MHACIESGVEEEEWRALGPGSHTCGGGGARVCSCRRRRRRRGLDPLGGGQRRGVGRVGKGRGKRPRTKKGPFRPPFLLFFSVAASASSSPPLCLSPPHRSSSSPCLLVHFLVCVYVRSVGSCKERGRRRKRKKG